MLQFSSATRALPRRVQAGQDNVRIVFCRSTEQQTAASVTTVERPRDNEDVKVKATISALDSLLGLQDTSSTATTSRTTSSSSASTSNSNAALRPAASSSSSQGSKLPTLPFGSSDSSGPRRKPAGLSFDQVMGFSGLAPEVINGRAAMIGFLTAISNEFRTGESMFAQMVSGGAAQALIVILAVTVASFAPAIRGAPLDEVFNKAPRKVTEWGPFTAAAEGLNGRLAMVGIGLLLFFEGAGSTAFFLN